MQATLLPYDQAANVIADVVVVVPVYLNSATLNEMTRRLVATFMAMGVRGEVLFVVDASPDDSWEVVQAIQNARDDVYGLLLGRRIGQHGAILEGLRARPAHWYAVMDADLQDPPEVLLPMLQLARQAGATVMAQRQGSYQAATRMLTSRVFKFMVAKLCDLPPRVGTFFVIDAHTACRVVQRAAKHPQVVALVGLCSSAILTVPYRREARPIGRSAYSSLDRLRSGALTLRCIWDYRRDWTGNDDS